MPNEMIHLSEEIVATTESMLANDKRDQLTKIPFTELSSLGAGMALLAEPFRTLTTHISIDAPNNLYAAYDKLGNPIELQYRFKGSPDYMGSQIKNGVTQQAHLKKVASLDGIVEQTISISPATLFMVAILVSMNKKLDAISDAQSEMMKWLEVDKQTKMEGDLQFLMDAYKSYKYNWNSDVFKRAMLVKTQDIKQDAEHNIRFYKTRLENTIDKNRTFQRKENVIKNISELDKSFSNYRLVLYLHGFATFLEVLFLENFNAPFLTEKIESLNEKAYDYREVYSYCYGRVEEAVLGALDGKVLKGLASVSDKIGKLTEHVPLINRTSLDELLQDGGSKLSSSISRKEKQLLSHFAENRDSSMQSFVDLLKQTRSICSENSAVYFDKENLYIDLPA